MPEFSDGRPKKAHPAARPHDHQLLFRGSIRTYTSFEVAGKRLGGDVINISVPVNSMVKLGQHGRSTRVSSTWTRNEAVLRVSNPKGGISLTG
jgi:aspartate carbamoyltransferase catalytic subunit